MRGALVVVELGAGLLVVVAAVVRVAVEVRVVVVEAVDDVAVEVVGPGTKGPPLPGAKRAKLAPLPGACEIMRVKATLKSLKKAAWLVA